MAVTVVCECSRTFELKDEFSGTLVRCPACGATARAGGGTATLTAAPPADPVFGRDLFLLRQKVALDERYMVSDEQGEPLLFVERPRHLLHNLGALIVGVVSGMLAAVAFGAIIPTSVGQQIAPILAFLIMFVMFGVGGGVAVGLSKNRHDSFHAGADRSAPKVLEILQDHKVRFPTQTFTVRDEQGRRLGILSKNYLYNAFRKEWLLHDWRGKPLCRVKEDSIILSLLRRLLGPIAAFVRTNFLFLQFGSERELGEFKRKLTILDRYVLDLTSDSTRLLDRRLAVAAAVMLDTGERR
jgi:hypothetical protein